MESEKNRINTNGKIIKEKLIVSYKNNFYDLTKFLFKHPGGINSLGEKSNKNIDASFHSVEHSKAAHYLLKEYKINSDNINLDERMEHLVDWNSAMLSQVSQLGDKYDDWVNLPVDRNLKLFENPILESLSKTSWYMPLIIWIPFIIFLLFDQISNFDESVNITLTLMMHLTVGIFLWTFLEYNLHRYLFHFNSRKNSILIILHFLIHGLHHKVPFDEYRLVFPPFPAFLIVTVLYQPALILHYFNIVPYPRLLLASGLIGYLCYDMTHYFIHHGNPRISFFYNMKRYHSYHHFVHHNQGFGISNTFWDKFYGTEIILKKLKYTLKWRY
ncbi:hypothetical protein PVAND_001762 [Polypedilum vanderplanki]|uniref:Fatty acid 2-hydroxylase n=1 Tax=Polypedilum vanderplanki TaxID=319348 RepID=A0A9J6BNW9_POLVA|nr:hypothetical protein PVAND_001762 [Polypedilum vanderplanki]